MAKPIELTHRFQDLHFRQIEPISQWSRQIPLNIPYEDFLQTLLSTAEQTRHRYSGTIIRNPDTNNVTSFTHTRFRRNAYGRPLKIARCQEAVNVLAGKFGSVANQELVLPGISRVILGLYEGQHTSGSRTEAEEPDYSLDNVREALGKIYTVDPTEVCSVRLDRAGNATHYAEEAASVTFRSEQFAHVYLVGHAMKQERFSVETFATRGLSYMVETEWCRNPDPVLPFAWERT